MEMKPSPSPSRNQHGGVGVLKLPPGFRFHPTDEELVLLYLKRKALSCPLPACIIPDIDLAKHNPWDLPGGCEQEQYFFALREAKYPNGGRANRAAGCGYWKATGRDRPVTVGKGGGGGQVVVGMKKSLVFYQGKAPNGLRTDWVMHEYRLSSPSSCSDIASRDWVLCRVFMKRRGTRVAGLDDDGHDEGRAVVEFIDFMGCRPSSPSASDSSCVTGEA